VEIKIFLSLILKRSGISKANDEREANVHLQIDILGEGNSVDKYSIAGSRALHNSSAIWSEWSRFQIER